MEIPVAAPIVVTQDAVRAHRLLGIEILRFITALGVLVFHYQHFYAAARNGAGFDITRQPFYGSLEFVYRFGYLGVQVFWCISGFIFFARYSAPVRRGAEQASTFVVSRFSRLYPLHFLTLIAVAGLQAVYLSRHNIYFVYQLNDWPHFVSQLFLASSWTIASGADSYSFNGPIWSISLEVIAYGVFFVVARYFSVSALCSAGLIVLFGALDAAFGHHPVLTCLIYFYCGALAFRAYEWAVAVRSRKWKVASASLLTAIVVSVLASLGRLPTAVATLLLAPIGVLFAASIFDTENRAVGSLVTTLGNTTYSSYLLHFPLQLGFVLICELVGQSLDLSSKAFFIAYIAGTVLLSALCYATYERPAQTHLRRMWALAKRARTAGAESNTLHATGER